MARTKQTARKRTGGKTLFALPAASRAGKRPPAAEAPAHSVAAETPAELRLRALGEESAAIHEELVRQGVHSPPEPAATDIVLCTVARDLLRAAGCVADENAGLADLLLQLHAREFGPGAALVDDKCRAVELFAKRTASARTGGGAPADAAM